MIYQYSVGECEALVSCQWTVINLQMLSSKELRDKFSLYVESSQKLQYLSWAMLILTTVKFLLAVWVFLKYAEIQVTFVDKIWMTVLVKGVGILRTTAGEDMQ